jgi:ABC-type dipeptide/oligopeptide/nickel transport system permease component
MSGVSRFIFRRVLMIPVALVLANFLGFAYAHLARIAQAARNPYFTRVATGSLFETYGTYFGKALWLDFGQLPNQVSVAEALATAGGASLGLLALATVLSIIAGLALGLGATRTSPPGVAPWLSLVCSVGLAMPGFYLGSLLILGSVFYALWGPGAAPPIPIQGFGWDSHLIYPLLALMLRPTVQIAQVTASLLSEQLREQYVLAARSFGYPWRAIRWKVALRNVYASVALAIAGSFRLLLGELIVVEWLFNWPGVGRLFAITLIPNLSSQAFGAVAPSYLDPPLVAAILTVSTGIFIASDLAASLVARLSDPRLSAAAAEAVQKSV